MNQILPVLGVKPGAEGAAVLIHPGSLRALKVWQWRKTSSGYLLRCDERPTQTVPAIGVDVFWRTGPYWLGVERITPPPRPNILATARLWERYEEEAQGAIERAEEAGKTYGGGLAARAHRFLRVHPDMYEPLTEDPPIVSGLGDFDSELVRDAAAIAAYVARIQLGEAKIAAGMHA